MCKENQLESQLLANKSCGSCRIDARVKQQEVLRGFYTAIRRRSAFALPSAALPPGRVMASRAKTGGRSGAGVSRRGQ